MRAARAHGRDLQFSLPSVGGRRGRFQTSSGSRFPSRDVAAVCSVQYGRALPPRRFRVGGTVRFSVDRLREFVDSHATETTALPP